MTELKNSSSDNIKLENDFGNISEQIDTTIKLIEDIKESSTIAITGIYGVGKTFFAKSLKYKLDQKNIKNIYLDLSKNDYKNPIVVITLAFSDLIQSSNNKEKLKTIVKSLLEILSKNFLNVDISNAIDTYFSKKDRDDIQDLKAFIREEVGQQKIIFLVDEIDRCKTEYAIDFLEIIKHFFEIENIIFILFINNDYIKKIDLGCGVDGVSYVEKYIDYNIPIYVDYLGVFNYYMNINYPRLNRNIMLNWLLSELKINTSRKVISLQNKLKNLKAKIKIDMHENYIIIIVLIIIKYFYEDDFISICEYKGSSIIVDLIGKLITGKHQLNIDLTSTDVFNNPEYYNNIGYYSTRLLYDLICLDEIISNHKYYEKTDIKEQVYMFMRNKSNNPYLLDVDYWIWQLMNPTKKLEDKFGTLDMEDIKRFITLFI